MKAILTSVSVDFSNITIEEIAIAIVGYSIVFLVLLSLYYIFNNLKKLINLNIRKSCCGRESIPISQKLTL